MCRCSLSHGWDCSDDLKASTSKASKQQYSKYSFQSFWWSFNEGKSSYRQGYDWQFGESFTGSSAISRESYLGVQGRKQFDPTVTNFGIKERKVNFLNKVKLRIWTVRTSSALTPSVTMKLSQSHYYHRATIITEPLPSVLVLENESQQPPKPIPGPWRSQYASAGEKRNGMILDQERTCPPPVPHATHRVCTGAEEGVMHSRKDYIPCTEIQCWVNILLNKMLQNTSLVCVCQKDSRGNWRMDS